MTAPTISTSKLWLLWGVGTLVVAGLLLGRMVLGGDRSALLAGQTTGAHHQFEIACETCHAAKPFASPRKAEKALNKTCVGCHKAELAAAEDSHPIKKFKSPRMARFWDKVDARLCTSCHIEHTPEITAPGAVTLAMDYCVACHSEGDQDVRVNRPSHAGLTYDTCATAGCHNFHDNRALYEDFLVKHAADPPHAAEPVATLAAAAGAARADAARLRGAMAQYLSAGAAPADALDSDAARAWAASAHAGTDAGCAACHAPDAAPDAATAAWIAEPGYETCAECHRDQSKTFAEGRHGMRAHPKIGKPRRLSKQLAALGVKLDRDLAKSLDAYLSDARPPAAMSVAEARLPMTDHAQDRTLTCGSCHDPHAQDLRRAAVESCASCHDDDHTRAYFGGPHHALWLAEIAGDAPAGSGVSCATCHMPKHEAGDRIVTTHNQNDGLRPNEKMIRPVCQDCHGLGFAIDALADPTLVARNFNGSPQRRIDSVDWALRRVETDVQGANQ